MFGFYSLGSKKGHLKSFWFSDFSFPQVFLTGKKEKKRRNTNILYGNTFVCHRVLGHVC